MLSADGARAPSASPGCGRPDRPPGRGRPPGPPELLVPRGCLVDHGRWASRSGWFLAGRRAALVPGVLEPAERGRQARPYCGPQVRPQ